MSCSEYEPLIEKHNAGTITEKEKAKLEAHARDCFDCRAARDGGILPQRRRTRERVKKNKAKSLPAFAAAMILIAVALIVIFTIRKTPQAETKSPPTPMGYVVESLHVPDVEKDSYLNANRKYETPEQGRLILEYTGGSRITVYGNTSLTLDGGPANPIIRLEYGMCECNFRNSGKVISAGGEIEVSGDAKIQASTRDIVRIKVLTGKAHVTSKEQMIEAAAGKTVIFEPGKPPGEYKKTPPGE
ncbi:MAG: FecR family protein [Planctomycetota bacterium]|jgi:hypothetical protein